jgi:hypothetical protein
MLTACATALTKTAIEARADVNWWAALAATTVNSTLPATINKFC